MVQLWLHRIREPGGLADGVQTFARMAQLWLHGRICPAKTRTKIRRQTRTKPSARPAHETQRDTQAPRPAPNPHTKAGTKPAHQTHAPRPARNPAPTAPARAQSAPRAVVTRPALSSRRCRGSRSLDLRLRAKSSRASLACPARVRGRSRGAGRCEIAIPVWWRSQRALRTTQHEIALHWLKIRAPPLDHAAPGVQTRYESASTSGHRVGR